MLHYCAAAVSSFVMRHAARGIPDDIRDVARHPDLFWPTLPPGSRLFRIRVFSLIDNILFTRISTDFAAAVTQTWMLSPFASGSVHPGPLPLPPLVVDASVAVNGGRRGYAFRLGGGLRRV